MFSNRIGGMTLRALVPLLILAALMAGMMCSEVSDAEADPAFCGDCSAYLQAVDASDLSVPSVAVGDPTAALSSVEDDSEPEDYSVLLYVFVVIAIVLIIGLAYVVLKTRSR